jgi:putative endonuclease
MSKTGCVYILSNPSRTLYIGVTSDLKQRLYEHKNRLYRGFTADYRIDRLVYYAEYEDISIAIDREKQLKGWRRSKKIALIERENRCWDDLAPRVMRARSFDFGSGIFRARKTSGSPPLRMTDLESATCAAARQAPALGIG